MNQYLYRRNSIQSCRTSNRYSSSVGTFPYPLEFSPFKYSAIIKTLKRLTIQIHKYSHHKQLQDNVYFQPTSITLNKSIVYKQFANLHPFLETHKSNA